jgi:site-specific recombinase XerD
MCSLFFTVTKRKKNMEKRNTFAYAFYARESKKAKNGLSPVELSISVNGSRVLMNLPYRVKPEEFNRKRRPKEIEEYLNAQRALINTVLTEMAQNGITVTAANLKEYFRSGGVKSYTSGELADDYLKILRLRVGKTMSQGVYRKYELVTEMFFEGFDRSKEATAITNQEVLKFFAILDKKYEHNTAAGMKAKFKAMITFGMDNDKIKVNPFQGIRITREKKAITYLTEEEIRKIRETPIDNDSLNKVRDVFIFQMASGLAFSDVAMLRPDDLQEKDGMFYISKRRVKTGTPFFAVVLPEGVEIFNKYNGHIPLISNQKSNLYLKSIQSICGIDTKLTTHLARHTYCTRLLNHGVPMTTVSRCAGHSTTKVTESYYAHLEDSTILSQVHMAMS